MVKNLQFKSLLDLVKVFKSEKACHQYLAYQRWEGLMQCPFDGCGNEQAYVFKDGIRYKCTACRKIYTAKTGTFMECSKLPTIKWIMAIYLVLHKRGISSVQLSKDVDVTQKTSWFMLHRIRYAFGNESTQTLNGTVMADECFVGGKNKNRHRHKKVKNATGRHCIDKTPVLGLIRAQEFEVVKRLHKLNPGKIVKERKILRQSYVKCFVIKDTRMPTMHPIITNVVEQNSIFVTDEWSAYNGLGHLYSRQVVDHGYSQYKNSLGYSTNAVEGFWSQAKRSIVGIYTSVSRKHTHRYFSEFSFKYNYRELTTQKQIDKVIQQMGCRLTYKVLITA